MEIIRVKYKLIFLKQKSKSNGKIKFNIKNIFTLTFSDLYTNWLVMQNIYNSIEGLNYKTWYLECTSNELKSLIHEFAIENPS